jgi:hypothetical protein
MKRKEAKMDKEKVKRAAIFLCIVGVMVGSFFWIESQRGSNSKEPATEENSTSDSLKKATTEESLINESSTNQGEHIEEQNKIKDFSNKLVNYDSVYKRNQSIKKFLTMKCIEENTIDVDPHVDVKATGKVITVANDLADQHSYIVLAEEKVNKSTNQVVISIHFNQELKKIDRYEINYIRSAS